MDTTSDGVYRRCGCTDPASRRRLGRRCPRLADPEHGSWYFAVQILGTSGRRRRLRRGGFASSRQAAAARQRVLADTAVGAAGQGWTVARWLRHWLSTLPLQVRPSTAAGYRAHAEEHLIPYLGRHTLARLTVGHLEAMFADIAAHSTRDGQPVTAATLQRIRATLRRALNVAVREQLLEVNPARLVLLPRPVRHPPLPWSPARVAAWRRSGEHPKVAVWTPLQLARFLATVREDWLFALWWLAALRGPRRGEICALRWVDVDLHAGTLTVSPGAPPRNGPGCIAAVVARHRHGATRKPILDGEGERRLSAGRPKVPGRNAPTDQRR
jgi:Phage integrase, N-terminal SAM-like domain